MVAHSRSSTGQEISSQKTVYPYAALPWDEAEVRFVVGIYIAVRPVVGMYISQAHRTHLLYSSRGAFYLHSDVEITPVVGLARGTPRKGLGDPPPLDHHRYGISAGVGAMH